MDYMIHHYHGLQFINGRRNNHSYRLHQASFKDYYGIQFFNGNSLQVSIDSRCGEVQNSGVLITYPGPYFEYGPPRGTASDHSYICFKGPRVEEYIANGLFSFDRDWPVMEITAPQQFQETMDQLLAIHYLNVEKSYNFAVNLLENLMLQLQFQPELSNVSTQFEKMILGLSEELRKNPELEWDFHKEAKRMHISYIYLRKLFRKSMGMPIGEFLIESRVNKAAQMLLDSDLQMPEIANACGFSDPFYFSRTFKKRRYLSPLKYRQEHRTYSYR